VERHRPNSTSNPPFRHSNPRTKFRTRPFLQCHRNRTGTHCRTRTSAARFRRIPSTSRCPCPALERILRRFGTFQAAHTVAFFIVHGSERPSKRRAFSTNKSRELRPSRVFCMANNAGSRTIFRSNLAASAVRRRSEFLLLLLLLRWALLLLLLLLRFIRKIVPFLIIDWHYGAT
jgi:hypothetical protein